MEVESCDHDHIDTSSSRAAEETTVVEEAENGDSRAKRGGRERAKKAANLDVLVDINGESKAEIFCRICHFGSEESSGGSELVPLGCDCRGELGLSHQSCAEAWFSQKGNRICEICEKTAENITLHSHEDTSIFMEEWHEMRLAAATLDSYSESSQRCKKTFCNLLLGFLVLAFLLPWLFRGTARL